MGDTDKQQEDWELAQLLRAAGPRPELPAQLKQRWEQQFRKELATTIMARKQRRRRRLLLGLCAGIAALAIGITVIPRTPSTPAPAIVIAHYSGSAWLPGGESAISHGLALVPGAELATGEDGHIALEFGDHELRLNADTRLKLGQRGADLLAGSVYVSDLTDRSKQGLVISTVHGSFEDIGTQFTVALSAAGTVATVRQGVVRVDNGSMQVQLEAPSGSASQIVLSSDGHVTRNTVAASGAAWEWVYRASAGYQLDGSSAYDFINWSARERGLTVEFASAAAEIHAHNTLLSGSLGTLTAETALVPILATTDLRAQPAKAGRLKIYLVTP